MADVGKRFGGPAAVSTSATTLFTVGGGKMAHIRNIHVTNTGASDISLRVSIGTMATTSAILYDVVVPGNGLLDWSGYVYMDAAEEMQIQASATGLTISVSGVEES